VGVSTRLSDDYPAMLCADLGLVSMATDTIGDAQVSSRPWSDPQSSPGVIGADII
jgi:hypothetical protein